MLADGQRQLAQRRAEFKRAQLDAGIGPRPEPQRLPVPQTAEVNTRNACSQVADSLLPSEESVNALIASLKLPPGYKRTLRRLPLNTRIAQLHGWQRVAHMRIERGDHPADLLAMVGVELPPLPESEGGVHPAYKHKLQVRTRITAAADDLSADFLFWIMHDRAKHVSSANTAQDLREYMASLGIPVWSTRRMNDVLRRGDGVYWDKSHRDRRDRRHVVYEKRSPKNVAASLGLADVGVQIDVKDHAWQGSLQDWHAAVWTGFKENHPGNGKISQETLAREFGISRRAAFYKDRRADVKSTPQVTGVRQPNENDTAKWEQINKHKTGYSWRRVRRWYTNERAYAEVHICWQDVSQYESTQTRLSAHGGERRKRIRAELKARLNALGDEHHGVDRSSARCCSEPSESVSVRRFNDAPRAYRFQSRHITRPAKVLKQSARAFTRFAESKGWRFQYSQVLQGGEACPA